MIKDLLVSFKDNFKEKTTNPFLGTYVLVWLFRNWELVFTVLNFDKDFKLKNKVDFIKGYYSSHEFLLDLVINILWAFLILIVTYLLVNLSRFIVNISEKQLTPWIYKITDSKSIVLKELYEGMRSERDDLQVRLDQERDSKSRLETRIKILQEEITEISNVKVESNGQESSSSILSESRISLKKLKEMNLLNEFLDTVTSIKKGNFINNTYKQIDEFIILGLVEYMSSHPNGGAKKYNLTAEGEQVLKLVRAED